MFPDCVRVVAPVPLCDKGLGYPVDMLKRAGLFLLGCGLVLSGCTRDKFVGRPDLVQAPVGSMPAPTVADLAVPSSDYVIGPADKLTVSVFGMDDRPREVTVDPAGDISEPFVGTVHASGLTTRQVEARIVTALERNHVRSPIVSVNVSEVVSQVITVSGEVTRPGIYPISGRISLERAIARAQGPTEFTRENYIVVFRTAMGRQYATLYDLRAIRNGVYADPAIYANDVIIVGESQARRLFKDTLSVAGLLAAPLVTVLRN